MISFVLQIYFSYTSAFYGIIMSIISIRVSVRSQEIQLIKAHWYCLSFVYWFCAITLVSGAYILSALIVTFYCNWRQKARAIHCQSVCARDMSNGPIVNEIRCNNNDYPSENIHDPYNREGLKSEWTKWFLSYYFERGTQSENSLNYGNAIS